MRPERRSDLPEYLIVVDDVSGGDIANVIRGRILVGQEKVRFTAIAYGRYGGQNVAPKLSAVAKKKLKGFFSDFDAFEEDLQLRLVEGKFDIDPKSARVHNHNHDGETRQRTS